MAQRRAMLLQSQASVTMFSALQLASSLQHCKCGDKESTLPQILMLGYNSPRAQTRAFLVHASCCIHHTGNRSTLPVLSLHTPLKIPHYGVHQYGSMQKRQYLSQKLYQLRSRAQTVRLYGTYLPVLRFLSQEPKQYCLPVSTNRALKL
jgi:hypothetical protein